MTARRPLLTAAAAGSVLFALWFVPSANAIVGTDGAKDSALRADSAPAAPGLTGTTDRADRASRTGSGAGAGAADSATSGERPSGTGSGAEDSGSAAPRHYLADTGSPDTTPYVIGGAACLAFGAGLVAYSVRRTRDETA
ncbi:hypothetical protein AB0C96_30020 [Streptomyces sp. NPDC048506]|uniref:hypothetical protein n=1 Tax=Streptomyces sp. NPDC048506 TaxID=3155028 RepID=UPI00342CFA4F